MLVSAIVILLAVLAIWGDAEKAGAQTDTTGVETESTARGSNAGNVESVTTVETPSTGVDELGLLSGSSGAVPPDLAGSGATGTSGASGDAGTSGAGAATVSTVDAGVEPVTTTPSSSSAAEPDAAQESNDRLLNLAIIGLLVLAALIAIATILFWRSTSPISPEGTDADAPEAGVVPPVARPANGEPDGATQATRMRVTAAQARAATPPAPAPPVAVPYQAPVAAVPRPVGGQPGVPAPGSFVVPGPGAVSTPAPSAPAAPAPSAAAPIPPVSTPPVVSAPGGAVGLSSAALFAASAPGVAPAASSFTVPPPSALPAPAERPFAKPQPSSAESAKPGATDAAPSTAVAPTPPAPQAFAAPAVAAPVPVKPIDPESLLEGGDPPVVVRRTQKGSKAKAMGPWGEGARIGQQPTDFPGIPADPDAPSFSRGVRIVPAPDPIPTESDEPVEGDDDGNS